MNQYNILTMLSPTELYLEIAIRCEARGAIRAAENLLECAILAEQYEKEV